MPPTASGTAAASTPPNTQTSTRKLIGIASDSMSSRSRCDCSVISTFTVASPPARTVTPSLSWTSRSDRSFAYSCVLLSSPAIPATISPDLPSLLTNAARSGAGAVHSDVTDATCGERIRSSTSSVPAARAATAVGPVRSGDDDHHLHVAHVELVRQQFLRLRRLRRRVLESAGAQALCHRHAEDARSHRHQCRHGEHPPRRGEGELCDAVQHATPGRGVASPTTVRGACALTPPNAASHGTTRPSETLKSTFGDFCHQSMT